MNLRILALTPRPLFPADTGGRIRSARIFERLSREHDITLVCFRTSADTTEDIARMVVCSSRLETVEWRESRKSGATFYLELARNVTAELPYTVRKYQSKAMSTRLEALLKAQPYDLLLCDFLQPSINCLDLSFTPKVLFQHNVEARIWTRHAQHVRNPLVRAYVSLQARKLRLFERRAAHAFDHCIVVSEKDRQLMARDYDAHHTTAIAAGVDAVYFVPAAAESEGAEVVFVGSMDMMANQDAMKFFVKEIFPFVRREVPATLVIVGRNPSSSITGLANSSVVVTGTVPDVRPHLARAHVVVVPLRFGGGTRIKILEAMAMAKPIVSTSLGAEGLPVTDGRDIWLADDPQAFAAAVVALLRAPSERARLGTAGRSVAEELSWDAVAGTFSQTCVNVVRASRAARAGPT